MTDRPDVPRSRADRIAELEAELSGRPRGAPRPAPADQAPPPTGPLAATPAAATTPATPAAPAAAAAPATPAAPAPRIPRGIARRNLGSGVHIECEGLVRIYKIADLEVVALQGLDLRIERGEMVAIVGASGSGKSTLLNILGGLDTPSAGRAIVAGHDLGQMRGADRTRYRRRVVGMIWQQTARNLLPYLDAAENVELPMTLDGRGGRARRERARELLALVGLSHRLRHRPDQLSGGEQQRVAIAVALANAPEVLLADEPTGELDTATSHEVFDLLGHVNHEVGTTIVIVTHDPLVSEQVGRTVAIRDGRTSTETLRRAEQTDEGDHRIIAEEFAVLDRAGRLQLPRAHVEQLGLRERVKLRLEEDHVGVWPTNGSPGSPADAARTSQPPPAASPDGPAR